jgi:hypothetical protein
MSGGALDRLLPDYQFVERHKAFVRANRQEVWVALHEVTPREMALTRILFGVRTLPARVTGARRAAPAGPWLASLLTSGFKVMAETPEQEVVLGTSGRFWELRARPRPQPDPGGAMAAVDFRLEDTQGGILLTTETRVAVEDRASRRRFAVYWVVIRLGSGLIRRDLLQAVRRRAERTSLGSHT